MGKSLQQIVNSALSEKDHAIKLASASDVSEPEPEDFLAEELGLTADKGGEPEPPKEEPAAEDSKTASEDILSDASYGMKLAAALDTAAGVVTELNAKQAMQQEGGGGAASPQVMQGEHQTQAQHPKAQSNSVPANQASHGGGPLGPQGKLENTMPEFRDTDWTKNKEAATALINAKIAQAEQLEAAGQLEQAETILAEANEISEKIAADPSSPQAKLPAHGTSHVLDTSPGPSSHIGDNASLISMTRASAKDKSQREASEFMSETPKKDNAVAAHVGKTDGLKLSSAQISAAREQLKKIAAKANDPEAAPEEREKAASLIDAVRARRAARTPTPEELLNA